MKKCRGFISTEQVIEAIRYAKDPNNQNMKQLREIVARMISAVTLWRPVSVGYILCPQPDELQPGYINPTVR